MGDFLKGLDELRKQAQQSAQEFVKSDAVQNMTAQAKESASHLAHQATDTSRKAMGIAASTMQQAVDSAREKTEQKNAAPIPLKQPQKAMSRTERKGDRRNAIIAVAVSFGALVAISVFCLIMSMVSGEDESVSNDARQTTQSQTDVNHREDNDKSSDMGDAKNDGSKTGKQPAEDNEQQSKTAEVDVNALTGRDAKQVVAELEGSGIKTIVHISGGTDDQTSTVSGAAPGSYTVESATKQDDMVELTVKLNVINAQNNPEFAALLSGPETGDAVASFASAYSGRAIEFDGYTAAVQRHENYKTRFDYLILSGDAGSVSGGPNFHFSDVNYYDLHLSANAPETFGTGLNIHVIATVEGYSSATGLFELKPVTISMR